MLCTIIKHQPSGQVSYFTIVLEIDFYDLQLILIFKAIAYKNNKKVTSYVVS